MDTQSIKLGIFLCTLFLSLLNAQPLWKDPHSLEIFLENTSQQPLRNFQVSQPPAIPKGSQSCFVPLVHHNFGNSYGQPAIVEYNVGPEVESFKYLTNSRTASHRVRSPRALVANRIELYGNLQRGKMTVY